MSRLPSRLRGAILAVLAILSAPFVYVGINHARGNIHEVEAGAFFRSGQLDGDTLQDLVQREGIRTILNLRGAHPEERWYVEETSIAEDNGIRYIPLAISARAIPDLSRMIDIATALRTSPQPILVHCMAGSDRSGLAAAIYELVVRGRSEQEASGQLSIVYGHFPWLGSETRAMDEAFADFAAYWRSDGARRAAMEVIEPTRVP